MIATPTAIQKSGISPKARKPIVMAQMSDV